MPEFIQIITTTASSDDAKRIAGVLVESRLAACVQIVGPIRSIYRWQGQIETAEEWQCWAKSRRDLYDEVEKTIRRLHSYDVPEILAMPIVAGHADYLAWLKKELSPPVI